VGALGVGALAAAALSYASRIKTGLFNIPTFLSDNSTSGRAGGVRKEGTRGRASRHANQDSRAGVDVREPRPMEGGGRAEGASDGIDHISILSQRSLRNKAKSTFSFGGSTCI